MNMAVHIPADTGIEFIALDKLHNPALRIVAGYWTAQRGEHSFPTRDEIKPRDIVSVLPHMSLLKVQGGDFLYRVVGDGVVRAFALPLQNRKLSDIAQDAPVFGTILQTILRGVVDNGEPAAVCGIIGRDFPQANFTNFELVCLPLGADHQTVDHVLAASTFIMRHSHH